MASMETAAYITKLEERLQALEAEQARSTRGVGSSQHAPANREPTPTIKPSKPETFEGRRDAAQVDRWLFQVWQYCDFVKMRNEDRVPFASLLLRDAAATWWRAKAMDAERRQTGRIQDWNEFETALSAQFKPANAVEWARDKLTNLRQTGSIKAYTDIFRSLVMEIPGIGEDELLDRFKRGLKLRTRQEVAIRRPKNLEEAEQLADEIDTLFFQERGTTRRPQENRRPTTAGPRHQDEAAPMDLDAYGNPRQSDRPRAKFQGACFTCSAKGHMARNCRQREQEVNGIAKDEDTSDESGKEGPQ